MNKLIGIGLVFALMLSACGGGGSSTTANNATTIATGSGIVSLSGVVAQGTAVGGVAVGAVGNSNVGTSINGVYPNAIVIATDKNGNTTSTTTDKAGAFTLKLNSGSAYVLIFIDSKTLKLLGSLVQAHAQTTAGAIKLQGNDDMGTIVINPTTQKAVSANEVNGTLKSTVTSAPAGLDSNGDGIVSKQEMNSMQATNLLNNAATLTQVSMANFSSQPGQWASIIQHTLVDPYAIFDTYSLVVADQVKIPGIKGSGLVNAVKETEVLYYDSTIDLTATGLIGSSSGFYQANILGYPDYTSPTYTSPPVSFDFWMGPTTWASASYVDAKNNQIHSLDIMGDPNTTWDQGSGAIPLNIQLGKTYPLPAAPSITAQFVMSIAKEQGNPFILKTTDNFAHSVFLVDISFLDALGQPASMSGVRLPKMSLYLLSGTGISINARDSQGNLLPPSQVFAHIPFGQIVTNPLGNFQSATNINPLATTPWNLTNVQRDEMLAYIWNNRDKAGVLPKSNAGSAISFQSYFNVNYDSYGQAASPGSWDPVTYMSMPLTGGITQQFSCNVNYASNNPVSFHYEFRITDTAGTSQVVASSASFAAPATQAMDTSAYVRLGVMPPTLMSLPVSAKYSYLDPVTGSNMSEGWVDLWLVMKDTSSGTVLMEQPLDTYVIH